MEIRLGTNPFLMLFTRRIRIMLLCFFIYSIEQTAFCQGAHSTNFKPGEDGFHFVNAFTNTFYEQPGIRITLSGCSGGMSYAALDYYNRKIRAPKQSYPPPDHSLLYDFIYNRQITSLFQNEEKWIEFIANPFGWQNNEFFYWGLQGSNGGRLQLLKNYLDNGIPVPLGLYIAADGRARPQNQVIAIGYDCGRYQGNLGDFQEDLKIYCYDPAYPDNISTLQVNKILHYYYWKDHENEGDHYMGYFVDTKYSATTPPADLSSSTSLPDCKAQELVVSFKTGENSLRGLDDNCNIMLQFSDGTVQQFVNVNRRMNWSVNSINMTELWLANPRPLNEFQSITIYTRPCDASSRIPCNNWDLNQLTIVARGGFPDDTVLNQIGYPLLKRFSGRDFSNRYYYTNLPACIPGDVNTSAVVSNTVSTTVNQLLIDFRTGNDDLQGGENNLSMMISYRDGTGQTISNINQGINWPANSSNKVMVRLNKAVIKSNIMRVELQTKKCQEGSCDSWNFQGITIKAKGDNIEQTIYEQSGNPIFRFTGANNAYSLVLNKY